MKTFHKIIIRANMTCGKPRGPYIDPETGCTRDAYMRSKRLYFVENLLNHCLQAQNMEYVQYGRTGTYAYFDGENYYNRAGQLLYDPIEYDPYQEGYTPFGDE